MKLITYTPSMEYTHMENVDGFAMTNAACECKWPSCSKFPTTSRGCANRAASMIKAGFVIHRNFESCFEMGNGDDVMALLVNDALGDDELRKAWTHCERYIGEFHTALNLYYARLGQPVCPNGQMQFALV